MIRLWLSNRVRGYDLASEPQTLEALQNAFITVRFIHIMYSFYLHAKANVLEAAA